MRENKERTNPQIVKTQKRGSTHTNPLRKQERVIHIQKKKMAKEVQTEERIGGAKAMSPNQERKANCQFKLSLYFLIICLRKSHLWHQPCAGNQAA